MNSIAVITIIFVILAILTASNVLLYGMYDKAMEEIKDLKERINHV